MCRDHERGDARLASQPEPAEAWLRAPGKSVPLPARCSLHKTYESQILFRDPPGSDVSCSFVAFFGI
jgi:hypothetical protein